MFQRIYFQALTKRLAEPRAFMQVLVGSRQVGKTTLIGQLLAASDTPNYFISADDVPNSNAVWLEQQWEVARQRFRQSEASEFILAIDEIQKISNWREGNDEVDFVLEHRSKTLAIEVKSGAKHGNLKGMNEFKKQFEPNKLLLVGSTGLAWQEFLTINPIELF